MWHVNVIWRVMWCAIWCVLWHVMCSVMWSVMWRVIWCVMWCKMWSVMWCVMWCVILSCPLLSIEGTSLDVTRRRSSDSIIFGNFWSKKRFGSTIEFPVVEEKVFTKVDGILKQKLNNLKNLFDVVKNNFIVITVKSKYFRCNCLKINKQPHQGCL